jgi:hypothetical protein
MSLWYKQRPFKVDLTTFGIEPNPGPFLLKSTGRRCNTLIFASRYVWWLFCITFSSVLLGVLLLLAYSTNIEFKKVMFLNDPTTVKAIKDHAVTYKQDFEHSQLMFAFFLGIIGGVILLFAKHITTVYSAMYNFGLRRIHRSILSGSENNAPEFIFWFKLFSQYESLYGEKFRPVGEHTRLMQVWCANTGGGWRRDLTMEGVEPNPGPVCESESCCMVNMKSCSTCLMITVLTGLMLLLGGEVAFSAYMYHTQPAVDCSDNKPQAGGWIPDLTTQGVEPNPGPKDKKGQGKAKAASLVEYGPVPNPPSAIVSNPPKRNKNKGGKKRGSRGGKQRSSMLERMQSASLRAAKDLSAVMMKPFSKFGVSLNTTELPTATAIAYLKASYSTVAGQFTLITWQPKCSSNVVIYNVTSASTSWQNGTSSVINSYNYSSLSSTLGSARVLSGGIRMTVYDAATSKPGLVAIGLMPTSVDMNSYSITSTTPSGIASSPTSRYVRIEPGSMSCEIQWRPQNEMDLDFYTYTLNGTGTVNYTSVPYIYLEGWPSTSTYFLESIMHLQGLAAPTTAAYLPENDPSTRVSMPTVYSEALNIIPEGSEYYLSAAAMYAAGEYMMHQIRRHGGLPQMVGVQPQLSTPAHTLPPPTTPNSDVDEKSQDTDISELERAANRLIVGGGELTGKELTSLIELLSEVKQQRKL